MQPLAVRLASKSAVFSPSLYTSVAFATAPTVIPLSLINPVTISFAYAAFVSTKTCPSEISLSTYLGSPFITSRLSHARFRSSPQSSTTPACALLPGSMLTSSRICAKISSAVPMPSTVPASSLWKAADAVSHLLALFPGIAFGEFTKIFAFSASANVKSERAGTTAMPPPQVPNTAVICGTTPDAATCFAYSVPTASSASTDSCSLMPAQSIKPMIGAPILTAMSYRPAIFFACISPIVPPNTPAS